MRIPNHTNGRSCEEIEIGREYHSRDGNSGTDAVSVFSVLLRVLGVSVVVISTPFSHHGDTENTEKHKDFKLHHYRNSHVGKVGLPPLKIECHSMLN